MLGPVKAPPKGRVRNGGQEKPPPPPNVGPPPCPLLFNCRSLHSFLEMQADACPPRGCDLYWGTQPHAFPPAVPENVMHSVSRTIRKLCVKAKCQKYGNRRMQNVCRTDNQRPMPNRYSDQAHGSTESHSGTPMTSVRQDCSTWSWKCRSSLCMITQTVEYISANTCTARGHGHCQYRSRNKHHDPLS